VVFNNAGYANLVAIEDISLDDFRAQVETVFYGTVHVTKAALPHFVSRGAGHFIQVTSVGGRPGARRRGSGVAPGGLTVLLAGP
jgi:NAD(P)-dependent dehydrogenase (short-subunit alcohol dehydrogenase family)